MAVQAYRDDGGRLRLMLSIPDGEVPTQLTLFKAGVTETTKGEVLFDQLSADMTMTKYEEKGQEQLPFDYDHGMLSFVVTPDGSKAAGWFTPGVVDGALTALDIEWTKAGRKGIEEKEFRFFSPAIELDEDNRVTRLINVALTNLPATKNQKPLVAHDAGADRPPKAEKDIHMDEILKLLGVKTEAEAIAALSRSANAIALLLSETGKDSADAAIAQVRSWKKEADSALKLAEKVRTLETEKVETQREQLITTLSEAGKLPAALHDWARTQSVESLTKFGEGARVDPKLTNHEEGTKTCTTLSDSEVEACRQLGMTRKEFLDAKAEKAQDDAAEQARREGRVL